MGFSFEPGQFYGEAQFGMKGAAFDIRAQVATGCEGDVQVHTHHDAHFVLVLSGRFISSARGARDSASAPTLIFNPPGTTHRDRFLKGVGTEMGHVSKSFTRLALAQLRVHWTLRHNGRLVY